MRRLLLALALATSVAPALITGVASAAPPPATGTTARASLINGTNAEPTAPSAQPAVDDAGDVVFATDAALDPGNDTNGVSDVYLRTAGGSTVLVSHASGGAAAGNKASDSPAISADGKFIAYRTDATNIVTVTGANSQVVVYNVLGNSNTLVSQSTGSVTGNGDSDQPAVADVGTTPWVAFRSAASNLVTGDFNGFRDIFLRDGTTTLRVSVDSNGVEADGPSFHPDVTVPGADLYVAFSSDADNLVTPDDSNGMRDVFLYSASQAAAATHTTQEVSRPSATVESDGTSDEPSVSDAAPPKVAFTSDADNLVSGDTNGVADVFVRARMDSAITRASVALSGTQGNLPSDSPSMSGSGTWVAFRSFATNLVPGDTNTLRDVFVHHLTGEGATIRVSVSSAGAEASGRSSEPSISSDGSHIAFSSDAANLVASDTNQVTDVFLRAQDVVAPAVPTATPDAGHVAGGAWSNDATISMSVSDTDTGGAYNSGVSGYSYVWDHSVGTVPGPTQNKAGVSVSIGSTLSTSASWYFHVRAVDNAGNWSATRTVGPFKIDVTKPVVSFVTESPTALGAATSTSLTLKWSGSDAHSGIKNFDVFYDRAAATKNAPGYDATVTLKSGTTARSTTLTVAKGYTYRFWVRARDNAGNTNTSFKTDVTVPTDNPSLSHTSKWSTVSGTAYFGGSALRTTTKGQTAGMTAHYIHGVGILVTICPTCGSIEILVNGAHLASETLQNATTMNKWVPAEYFFTATKATATITVKVTSSGKPVILDGIVALRP